MKKAIKLLSAGAIMLSMMTITSCSSDSEDPDLPPIGGYNNSDEVAAANRVAKWSFEGNATELQNNTTGAATNVAFATGAKGQCWQGSSSQPRYAVYSAGAAITGMNSYSLSFWMNSDTMKLPLAAPTQGHGAQGIFAIVDQAGFWGGMNLFIENRSPADGDTLRVKLLVENKRAGVIWAGQGPILRIPNARNTWKHVVLTYDASTSRFTGYVDGAIGGKMEVPYGPVFGGTYIQYADNPGGLDNPNSAPLYGALQMAPSTQMVIGSHQFTTTPALNTGGTQQPWATTFAGQLDEFRIFKSALSASDVSALYQLEKAGR